MKQDNPAVTRQLQTPPAMLEEVEKDPKAMSGWARKLLLVQINQMHLDVRTKDIPLSQRLQFAELLAKLGDAVPRASVPAAAGSGFSVNIVFGDNTRKKVDLEPVVEVVDAAPQPLTNDLVADE